METVHELEARCTTIVRHCIKVTALRSRGNIDSASKGEATSYDIDKPHKITLPQKRSCRASYSNLVGV